MPWRKREEKLVNANSYDVCFLERYMREGKIFLPRQARVAWQAGEQCLALERVNVMSLMHGTVFSRSELLWRNPGGWTHRCAGENGLHAFPGSAGLWPAKKSRRPPFQCHGPLNHHAARKGKLSQRRQPRHGLTAHRGFVRRENLSRRAALLQGQPLTPYLKSLVGIGRLGGEGLKKGAVQAARSTGGPSWVSAQGDLIVPGGAPPRRDCFVPWRVALSAKKIALGGSWHGTHAKAPRQRPVRALESLAAFLVSMEARILAT